MGYNYPHYHRFSEILGILFFLGYCFLLIFDVLPLINQATIFYKFVFLVALPILAFLAADFTSGLVHFLCDNFGSPQTPYLGPSFIKSFRDHHTDPKGITRHDFIEVNGSNCIISVPLLALAFHTFDYDKSSLELVLTIFLLFMLIFIFLTNQFHKWAHQDDPPGLVKRLQNLNLVLSPKHHAKHHAEPYDKYYCITNGWLNPLLSRIRFFEFTEVFLRHVFYSPKDLKIDRTDQVPGEYYYEKEKLNNTIAEEIPTSESKKAENLCIQ